jgi:predicted O-methyltransferase YrrM
MTAIIELKNFVKNLGDFIFWPLSEKKISSLLNRFSDNDGSTIFKICEAYKGYGWYTSLHHLQKKDEFVGMINIARKINPKVTLEIGTFKGSTLLGWSQITRDKVVSIDLPEGYSPKKEKFYKSFSRLSNKPEILPLRSNSQSPETLQKVREFIGNAPIDILFIDGDHTYNGVKRDYELWSPLVRKGGVIFFHDILENPNYPSYGSPVFWQELKKKYRCEELIENRQQQEMGIGVLYVD